jgi:hypothetical protein
MRSAQHHASLMLAVLTLLIGPALAASADEPKSVAGTWTWTWKDGEGKTHKHVLDLEAAGGKLTGRERFDDLDSVKVDDLKLRDGELTFVVTRGPRRSEYTGKLVGTKVINGQVNVAIQGQSTEYQWTAERAVVTKKD